MLSLMLMEVLSVTALLYSLLLLFLPFAEPPALALVFLWTVGVALAYGELKKRQRAEERETEEEPKKKTWGHPLAFLFLLPLYFFHTTAAIIFFLFSVPLLMIYADKYFGRGGHLDYVDNFRRSSFALPFAFFMRWTGANTGEAISKVSPFIFLYVLSAMMLIRAVRHVESGMDIKSLRKTNTAYLLFVGTVLLSFTLEPVRLFWALIAKGVLALLVLPLQLALGLISFLVGLLGNLQFFGKLRPDKVPEMPSFGEAAELPDLEMAEKIFAPHLLAILKALGALAVAAIVFYLLYKLLSLAGGGTYSGVNYTEEREFMVGAGRKRRRLRSKERLPLGFSEQIRFYYRRFLEKLEAKQVAIEPEHTSQEIMQKAETVFSSGPGEMRELYIRSRYGKRAAQATEAERMAKLYRDL